VPAQPGLSAYPGVVQPRAIVETAAMTAPADSAPITTPRRHSRFRRWGLPTALALVLGGAYVARTFYIESFKVPQQGMAPTLVGGDHIFVRKDAYGIRQHAVPARGDIVVFRSPENPAQDMVQRVIGVPGDTIVVQQGAVFINGWRVPTCVAGVVEVEVDGKNVAGFAVVELLGDTAYLVFHDPPKHEHEHGEESEEHAHPRESEGPYTVSHNEVFVLGDNREHSEDSRYWFDGRGGGVPVGHIKGRASSIWMSNRKTKSVWGGASLAVPPKCPEGFSEGTCAGVERCLSNRPSRDQTTPPEDRSPGTASPQQATPRP
jgi:signal peptidase I